MTDVVDRMRIESDVVGEGEPTLVFVHGFDRPNPWIELVTANAPQAEVRMISGAGHFTHIDAPDQVNAELDRLARQIADQGGLRA